MLAAHQQTHIYPTCENNIQPILEFNVDAKFHFDVELALKFLCWPNLKMAILSQHGEL